MTERLKVVDFSTHISGPGASQQLIQLLDADVIKVENPRTGDGNRGEPPMINGLGMYHHTLNSGARSFAVDRRSELWDPAVRALAEWADVVIVGAQPESAKKRGIDFDTLKQYNDRLVYCLVTGYGTRGPWANYPAHGLNPEMLAGRVPVVETPDGGVAAREDYRSVGTTLASVFGVVGILAALQRRGDGVGAQQVEVSLWQTALWLSWRDLATLSNLDDTWHAYGTLGPRFAMYETSDHVPVLVCPIERRYWVDFCDLVGLPESWKETGDWTLSNLDYGEKYPEQAAGIREAFRQQPLAYWTKGLEETDIPFSPNLTLKEAIDSEHAQANEVMVNSGDGVRIAASPVLIRDASGQVAPRGDLAGPPSLGRDTDAIIHELGISTK